MPIDQGERKTLFGYNLRSAIDLIFKFTLADLFAYLKQFPLIWPGAVYVRACLFSKFNAAIFYCGCELLWLAQWLVTSIYALQRICACFYTTHLISSINLMNPIKLTHINYNKKSILMPLVVINNLPFQYLISLCCVFMGLLYMKLCNG